VEQEEVNGVCAGADRTPTSSADFVVDEDDDARGELTGFVLAMMMASLGGETWIPTAKERFACVCYPPMLISASKRFVKKLIPISVSSRAQGRTRSCNG
jgi:hypothetical protein